MKTTIEMSDELFGRVKRTAAEEGITLKEFIERSVRRELSRPHIEEFALADHSVDGDGTQPGVTEGDWDTIRSMIYEGRGG